jgi:ABC-type methionine transport system permease subunit
MQLLPPPPPLLLLLLLLSADGGDGGGGCLAMLASQYGTPRFHKKAASLTSSSLAR